jgi:hypothetical protein
VEKKLDLGICNEACVMTTFWLTFSDPEATVNKRFLGVAIFDMDEKDGDLGMTEIIRRAWQLGINPGGAVAVLDVTGNSRIGEEHKNKLITDDALLISLGSTGRASADCN